MAAAAAATRWFQLYLYRDREIARALVARVEAAGYSALCLTVDGLAVDGERGVQRVLTLLRDDLALSMALAGCPNLGAVRRLTVV